MNKTYIEINTTVYRGVDVNGFKKFMGLDDSISVDKILKNKDKFIGKQR